MKILQKRLEISRDANQPGDQAEFRKRYFTMDHMQVMNQLIEKKANTELYKLQIYIAFIDYKKQLTPSDTKIFFLPPGNKIFKVKRTD